MALLNNTYMTYYKWVFKAMRNLAVLSESESSVEHIISSPNDEMEVKVKIKIIEELIKKRNYQKAETLLNKLLQVVPDDWQGKLLLGTCKLLQGDIEAAQKIHAEAEAHFESGTNLTENEKIFWKKYKKVFIMSYDIFNNVLEDIPCILFV